MSKSIMKELPWECDADGMIIGARAHDSVLDTLHFQRKESLRVTFVRIDGTKVELAYEGVRTASIGPVWDTSVLDSIFAWKSRDVPFSTGEDVGWNALLFKRIPKNELLKESQKIATSPEKLFLSVLGFVHGASIAVLFERLRIFDSN